MEEVGNATFGLQLLEASKQNLSQMRCEETLKRVSRFLVDWEDGRRNPDRVATIIAGYVNEVNELYPLQSKGVIKIEELLYEMAPLINENGAEWIIDNKDWNEQSFKNMMDTARLLSVKIKETSDVVTKNLLIGLALIMQYEAFTEFAESMIDSLMVAARGRANTKDEIEKRKRIREEIYCVDKMISGRSDVCRIRDAYAHAHFTINGDGTIHLWDELHGKRVFDATYTFEELRTITNSFNEKVVLISILGNLQLSYGHLMRQ